MPEFDLLSLQLQNAIDSAFDTANKHVSYPVDLGLVPPSAKRRRLEHDDGELTNYHVQEGGGFLTDRNTKEFANLDQQGRKIHPDYLALPLVPTALQILDLTPDDPDVLSTFKTAASGWGVLPEGEIGVRREDWREVCAVLLDGRADDCEDDAGSSSAIGGGGFLIEEDEDPYALVESDIDPDSTDEYRMSEDDNVRPGGMGSSSPVEYEDNHSDSLITRSGRRIKIKPSVDNDVREAPVRRSRKIPVPSGSGSGSDSDAPYNITPRQRAEARKSFALFFDSLDPPPDDADLDRRRIMIKDITRVSGLLSLKLKTEEIMEMLEAFSTSADKSIGLDDFERLVVAIRLV